MDLLLGAGFLAVFAGFGLQPDRNIEGIGV
jgi:hypothetical protein